MTDPLVEIVARDWVWTGIQPEAVIAISAMGHLIVRDRHGAFWYLDPELVTLERVAADETGLFVHMKRPEIREVWESLALAEAAREQLGEPGQGRCYALKVPALLGGDYRPENLCTLPIAELVSFAGSLGLQTSDLPDGQQVVLNVVE